VFDRHATLAGNQIINYRVSPDQTWLVLVGISSNPAAGQPGQTAFKIKGSMQLYSVERGVSQPIEGHAATFANVKQDGAAQPSKLFSFAVRTAVGAKVSPLYWTALTIAAPYRRDRSPSSQSPIPEESRRCLLPS